MLLNLIKKDLILAKKYLFFMFIFAIGAPIFIEVKTNFMSEGFLGFFITVLFIQYMLFNTVSMLEYKSNGAVLLCTTPYTRNALVKAKYLLILIIFVFSYILYTVTSFLAPIDIPMLSISAVGISLLIITIFFGIYIPIQYQLGFEKTKYIAAALIFISPFIFTNIVKLVQQNNIGLQIRLPFENLFPYFIALVIGSASMIVSTHIYSRKDL